MDNVTGMSIQEYAAMRELECEHKKGWGATAAIWVIAAVIVIAFFVYSWHNNCNEKVQFAVGLANLTGRVNCMEPDVRWAGQQLYAANGAISATVQGVGDMKANFGEQLFQLNKEVFYNDGCGCGRGRNGGCGGCGNREFRQTSTYNLPVPMLRWMKLAAIDFVRVGIPPSFIINRKKAGLCLNQE